MTRSPEEQRTNPLQSLTPEMILTRLADHYDWERLESLIAINCFDMDPSIKSSLTFQRRTPWAEERSGPCTLAPVFPEPGQKE